MFESREGQKERPIGPYGQKTFLPSLTGLAPSYPGSPSVQNAGLFSVENEEALRARLAEGRLEITTNYLHVAMVSQSVSGRAGDARFGEQGSEK